MLLLPLDFPTKGFPEVLLIIPRNRGVIQWGRGSLSGFVTHLEQQFSSPPWHVPVAAKVGGHAPARQNFPWVRHSTVSAKRGSAEPVGSGRSYKTSAFCLKWWEVNAQQIMCCLYNEWHPERRCSCSHPLHHQILPFSWWWLTNPFALHGIFVSHLK